MENERLKKQLDFLLELDKMKNLYRQTYTANDDLPRGNSEFDENFKEQKPLPRRENDAEHSFSLAFAAILLAEHTNVHVDMAHVIKMVLTHDVVEIDAGDTYCYDTDGYKSKRERETKAADRIFGLLPDDQCAEMKSLWNEFEENSTPAANFANALDRLQPLLLNLSRDGISWKEHGIKFSQVAERNKVIAKGSGELWEYFYSLLEEAKNKDILPE